MSSILDVGGAEIINVSNGINDTDAITMGQMKKNGKKYIVNISSGVGTVYLTDDGFVTGNALYTEFTGAIIKIPNEHQSMYGKGWSISGDLKTLTINLTQQSFGAITLLATLLFNSVSMVNVSSMTVEVVVFGK